MFQVQTSTCLSFRHQHAWESNTKIFQVLHITSCFQDEEEEGPVREVTIEALSAEAQEVDNTGTVLPPGLRKDEPPSSVQDNNHAVVNNVESGSYIFCLIFIYIYIYIYIYSSLSQDWHVSFSEVKLLCMFQNNSPSNPM